MFAATLQPSWPSRQKINVTFLFYFLRLYNFCFTEIFVGSTGSELHRPWISKITTEPKKSQKKKKFFELNLEVLLLNRSLWNFTWSLQLSAICLNLNLWIYKNFVCPLHRHEKWAYFYVMEAKNGHFSVFSSWKIHWSKFFSRAHQKNFMIFEHNLPKFHQNLKNFY